MVRISIIIPSFNQRIYLDEAIDSVICQNYPSVECIVIDGGSKDGSVELMESKKKHLSYWESERDRGQSHAINKGLAKAKGDIITFIGSDDKYLPGTFQDVAEKWGMLKDYGAIVGSFYYMDENSVLDSEPRTPYLPHEGPIDLTIGPPANYRLHQVSTFYNRKALDDVGRHVREDLKYTMDRELLYRVALKYKIFLTDRPYAAFRRHPESKSISDILPFSKEFAKLHRMHLSGDKEKDRMRIKMARHHRAKGLIKFARSIINPLSGASCLMAALAYRPDLAINKGYYATWLKVIGFNRNKKQT